MGWNHQLMILLFSTRDPYALFVEILPQTWSHRWLQGTSGSRSQGMGNWQDTSCLYLHCLGIGTGKLSKKAPPVWWLNKLFFRDMIISGPLIETWVQLLFSMELLHWYLYETISIGVNLDLYNLFVCWFIVDLSPCASEGEVASSIN